MNIWAYVKGTCHSLLVEVDECTALGAHQSYGFDHSKRLHAVQISALNRDALGRQNDRAHLHKSHKFLEARRVGQATKVKSP